MFIVLEGIDGSGKSTQAKLLQERLIDHKHSALLTCEPTQGDYGKEIRKIFSGKKKVDQHTIAALFLADRLEHILHPTEGMLTLLQQGHTIISDRYYLSSYAYHGAHVDMDWVIDINKKPAELLKPDMHIYLDMPPENAMERIKASRVSEQIEIYETLENLQKVYKNYEQAISKVENSEVIKRVDATLSTEEVALAIWAEVETSLAQ